MVSKTEAIVLRRFNYGNTSHVLAFYSRRYGQLRLIAKGVRRRSRKRAGEVTPQLFAGGEAVFYPSRSGGLGVLKEWCEVVPRAGIAARAGRYLAASYVAEVLEGATREGEPSLALYSLAAETLDAIAGAGRSETILSVFELGLLAALGLAPETMRCTVCGRDVAGESKVHFSPVEGGAVCPDCARGGVGHTVVLTPGAVAALRHLARLRPASAEGVKLKPGEIGAIREALTGSVVSVLEKAPRSIKYSKTLEIAARGR